MVVVEVVVVEVVVLALVQTQIPAPCPLEGDMQGQAENKTTNLTTEQLYIVCYTNRFLFIRYICHPHELPVTYLSNDAIMSTLAGSIITTTKVN